MLRSLVGSEMCIRDRGLTVTVRDTRGRDADAACGQLHERVMAERTKVSA